MDPAQVLLSILDRSATATTQEEINAAEQDFYSFLEENENVLEILFSLYVSLPPKRTVVRTYISICINKKFPEASPEYREQVIQEIFEVCRSIETNQEKPMFANILYKAFRYTENWGELFEAALSFDDYFCLEILSSSYNTPMLDIIKEHIVDLIQKCAGCFQAVGIECLNTIVPIFIIASDIEECDEAMPLFLEIVQACTPQMDSLTEEQLYGLWAIISGLISKGVIGQESYPEFLELIKSSGAEDATPAIKNLSHLADCIKVLTEENLVATIQLSIELCAQSMSENDGELDVTALDVIHESILTRKTAPMLVTQANELIQSEEPIQRALGARILARVLNSDSSALQSQFEGLKDIFVTILTSEEEEMVVKASVLLGLVEFDSVTAEASSIANDLIKAVLPYILNEDEKIRSIAYQVLLSLSESCDTEVEGLFAEVWGVMESIPESDIVDYIKFVGTILEKSADLEDDLVDALYEWIDTLTNEEQDITIRAGSLFLIATLMKQQNDVLEDLVIVANSIVEASLQFENDDVVCDALSYLKMIAETFRDKSVEIIQPFLPQLSQILHSSDEINRNTSEALKTVAFYIGYADNTQPEIIDDAIQCVKAQFESEDDIDVLNDVISSAGTISKGLVPIEGEEERNEHYAQSIHEMFAMTLKIAAESEEIDVVYNAFSNLKPILKHGVMFNGELFLQESIEFVSNFLNGSMAILEGTPAKDSDLIGQIVEGAMEFIGKIFQQKIDANELAMELLQWLNTTEDSTCQFSLAGALSDAIEFCDVAEEIPSGLCQFVFERADQLNDPDLQQNIAYFLSVILRKYPQLLETIAQLKPYIDQWWSNAIEKESGYQELAANIASFWLSFSALAPDFPLETLHQCLARFPPADLAETTTQCELIASIFSREQTPETNLYAAIAISKLLTLPQNKIVKRNVSDELLAQMRELFKALCTTEEIQQAILRQYANSKQKKSIIMSILSE